jgi:phage tail protein X
MTSDPRCGRPPRDRHGPDNGVNVGQRGPCPRGLRSLRGAGHRRSDLCLKLLLDEHPSPGIARQLPERGHDAIAVGERTDLRGRPDRVHFASLPEEQRVIVTRDLADLGPCSPSCCGGARRPMVWRAFGRLVAALEALLQTNPDVDAAISVGGEIWLPDPPTNSAAAVSPECAGFPLSGARLRVPCLPRASQSARLRRRELVATRMPGPAAFVPDTGEACQLRAT